MKFVSITLVVLIAVACQQTPRQSVKNEAASTHASTGNFGNEFSTDNSTPASQIANIFVGPDTATITISGNIASCCRHSGCWMDLDIGNGETIHVTFKDELFTIPLDAAGKNAVAEGIAIRELIPVETLQNYAREEGKSEEEVAAITEPVYAYEFIANGVLIEE